MANRLVEITLNTGIRYKVFCKDSYEKYQIDRDCEKHKGIIKSVEEKNCYINTFDQWRQILKK